MLHKRGMLHVRNSRAAIGLETALRMLGPAAYVASFLDVRRGCETTGVFTSVIHAPKNEEAGRSVMGVEGFPKPTARWTLNRV
jgi:hypothetical protein